AASFERIHRSNLVGMGVLPLQFPDGTTAQSLGLDGSEVFSIGGLSDTIKPGQTVTLEIKGKDQQKRSVPVKVRIDTPIEIDYYRHGGVLPFVLRHLLSRDKSPALLHGNWGPIGNECRARRLTQRFGELFTVKSRNVSVKFKAGRIPDFPARVFHAVFAATVPHTRVSPIMFRNELGV